MAYVVNRYKDPEDVYIGRGSLWGNPVPMKTERDRDGVVEAYRRHLWDQIRQGVVTIDDLIALDGKALGCFCAPRRCHGDVIVEAIKWAKKIKQGVDKT